MKIRSVPRNAKLRPGRRKVRSTIVTPALSETDALLRPAAAQRGRLEVEHQKVRGSADQIAALRPRVGGPLSGAPQLLDDDEPYVVAVDSQALRLAPLINEDLLGYEEVARAAGTDQAGHRAQLRRAEAAAGAYLNGRERLRDVDDSLRVVADHNRGLRRALRGAIPALLQSGTLAPPAQAALQTLWRRIEDEEAQQAAQAGKAERSGAARDEKAAGEVARTDRREELLRTMLDLRAGQPVPRERLGRAADTLDEINAADDAPPERRDRSR